MAALTFAAIAFVTITLICWAVEQYEQMRKSARKQLRRERGAK